MTNSVKSTLSAVSKQPSTGHKSGTNVSFDQFSIAPSSVATNFKRPGSIASSGGTKRSAKSYNKVEKNFTMTPRFSLMTSPIPPPSTMVAMKTGLDRSGAQGFDAAARSVSIGVHHRLPIGQHLVTEIKRRPTTWPTEFKDEPEYDPYEQARQSRRRIEAALRMYPRNTWGPTTKWGYLDEIPGNREFKQREHFKDSNDNCNHDRLEKERLGKRDNGLIRNWIKYQDATHLWENNEEACQSLAYGESQDRWARNAEKMLHAQNDQRLAKIKGSDVRQRSIKNTREFTRLEKREEEYLKKIEEEVQYRKDPGARKIKSSVHYDILAPDFKPGEDSFPVKMKKWRACMRSLRIQSKQSGARMYDAITWKPQKLCCVPPPKPEPSDMPPEPPQENQPQERKPSPARPRNILHSMDRVEEVPLGSTQDNRTNW